MTWRPRLGGLGAALQGIADLPVDKQRRGQADGAQLGEEFVKGGRAGRLPPVDVGFDLTLKEVPQCLAENLMFVRLDHTQDATTG